MAREEEQDVEAKEEAERERKRFLLTPATATWKMSQDDFRRIARTGEHAPAAKQE